jgi:hypothetical protein
MNGRAKPDVRTNDPTSDAGVARADMKFEVSSSPFRMSTRLYADYDSGKDFRVIQFTPPELGLLDHLRQQRHAVCASQPMSTLHTALRRHGRRLHLRHHYRTRRRPRPPIEESLRELATPHPVA